MESLLLLVLYFSMFIYGNILKGTALTVVNFIVFLLLFGLSLYFNKKIINKALRSFKEDFKKNIKHIIVSSIITAIAYTITTIIVGAILSKGVITKSSVANSNIFQVIINLLIWAPITEELIFRACLKKEIKNKTLFIIASSLLFSYVHVLGGGFYIDSLINTLPYIVMGVYFAILYNKTDNIVINILMHLLVNVVGVVIILCMI